MKDDICGGAAEQKRENKRFHEQLPVKYERYGVILNRLTIDKIEMVRNWRNDPKISQYMFFQDYITEEMQLEWFNKINNDANWYFIAVYDNKEIGLANVKNIDYGKMCGETGIFIYEDEYLGSDVPFRVSFCLGDFVTEELGLDYTYGRIVPGNKRAVKYNQMLGGKVEMSGDGKQLLLTVSMESYISKRSNLVRLLDGGHRL